MKKLNNHRIGIDSGLANLFSDFATEGEMWAGNGDRSRTAIVVFSERFLSPPQIQIGFSMWDISNSTNTRVDIAAEEITEVGFKIVFQTWGDTKVARMRASWMAIGEVQNEEIWDV